MMGPPGWGCCRDLSRTWREEKGPFAASKPPSKFSPAIPSPISRRAAWGRAGKALPRRSGPTSLLSPHLALSLAACLGSLFSFFSIFSLPLKSKTAAHNAWQRHKQRGEQIPRCFGARGGVPLSPQPLPERGRSRWTGETGLNWRLGAARGGAGAGR